MRQMGHKLVKKETKDMSIDTTDDHAIKEAWTDIWAISKGLFIAIEALRSAKLQFPAIADNEELILICDDLINDTKALAYQVWLKGVYEGLEDQI